VCESTFTFFEWTYQIQPSCGERPGNERCLNLVFYLEGNLMIPRVAVEKTYKATTGCGAHNLIHPGLPEGIFFACLIKISIINTHLLIFIRLGTRTGLASHSRLYTSLMKLASNNLAISLFITYFLSWAKWRSHSLTGLTFGSRCSSCSINSL
jgi:hypothetical protein